MKLKVRKVYPVKSDEASACLAEITAGSSAYSTGQVI